ncbi:MAG: hypothetical protein KJP16_03505 [Gammaproteobacteria bacterium]|nr:hypothetical protein [Gammaproteobacteria bacterium]NNL49860.1 hypothetical protein [Woeseiaceae bacterium]
MNEFEKYPNLMMAVLGLPPWATHLRTLNNLNTLAAVILAIVVALTKSIGAGAIYFGLYTVAWLLVAAIGSKLAQSKSMLASIVVAAIILITVNVTLALHFLEVWSPIGID